MRLDRTTNAKLAYLAEELGTEPGPDTIAYVVELFYALYQMNEPDKHANKPQRHPKYPWVPPIPEALLRRAPWATSGYLGVTVKRNGYQVQMMDADAGKPVYLGHFTDLITAARLATAEYWKRHPEHRPEGIDVTGWLNYHRP